jgi:transposase
MDDRDELLARIARLEALVGEQAARIKELEAELRRRGKKFTPKANAKPPAPQPDRRTKPFRRHPGTTRPIPCPSPSEEIIEHDVAIAECPQCGGTMSPTGEFSDHFVEDIPEPKVEVHRYRRHVCRCQACGATAQGRGDLAAPGSHLGPRARLLTVYGRAHLGISLGKTTALFEELFGLRLSTAAASGHLRWFSQHFHPVVQELLMILRASPVVHADETGWRINGKNVWCWCFSNPKLAVFLIDRHRSAAVVRAALGDSLPGVLVTDFYAAYHAIACRKQRCLAHLLRELAKLRDELPAAAVARHIRPLIELFQDAIALAGRRGELPTEAFSEQAAEIKRRFHDRWWRDSIDPDCRRIYDRLRRHRDELLVFLDNPAVPPDNNAAERDIRSVAAARSDGGLSRTAWGAQAFGVAKSIIRTCRKNGRNFFDYALAALPPLSLGKTAPLPLADSS